MQYSILFNLNMAIKVEIDEFFTGKFPRFNQNHMKPIFFAICKKDYT